MSSSVEDGRHRGHPQGHLAERWPTHWSTQDPVIMVAARSHGSWQKTSKTTAMAQHDARIIVVAGATGLQGGAVSRRLLRAHWRVRALTRNPDGKKVHALAQLGAEVRHRC